MKISINMVMFCMLISLLFVIIYNIIMKQIQKEKKQYEDQVFKLYFESITIHRIIKNNSDIIKTWFIINNIYEMGYVEKLILIMNRNFQFKHKVIIEKNSPTSIKITHIKNINLIDSKNFQINIAKFLADLELFGEDYLIK